MSAGLIGPDSFDGRGAGRLKAAAGIVRAPGARLGDVRGEEDLFADRGDRYGDSEGVLDGDSRAVRYEVPPPMLILLELIFRSGILI